MRIGTIQPSTSSNCRVSIVSIRLTGTTLILATTLCPYDCLHGDFLVNEAYWEGEAGERSRTFNIALASLSWSIVQIGEVEQHRPVSIVLSDR